MIKYRKDISKEIIKSIEFTIELKIMEAAEKIKEYGWGDLSAMEAGKIGGLLVSRLKQKSSP